ncbi:unnamed protein product [Cuscuta epithymum]|uniref:Uncharacterized protein n=1 Tax=Cuscuta epithymum TaxID=186058 RepID=A0AAV0EJF2_9ASTE|nr:unnamed protein product [Cuscuta epithymum]
MGLQKMESAYVGLLLVLNLNRTEFPFSSYFTLNELFAPANFHKTLSLLFIFSFAEASTANCWRSGRRETMKHDEQADGDLIGKNRFRLGGGRVCSGGGRIGVAAAKICRGG